MHNLHSKLPCLNKDGCNDSITARNRGFTAGTDTAIAVGCTRDTFNCNERQFVYNCTFKVNTVWVGRYDLVWLMETARRRFENTWRIYFTLQFFIVVPVDFIWPIKIGLFLHFRGLKAVTLIQNKWKAARKGDVSKWQRIKKQPYILNAVKYRIRFWYHKSHFL
jgi:hypothetical protein